MQLGAHAILNVTRALFRHPSRVEIFCFSLIFALRHLPRLTLGYVNSWSWYYLTPQYHENIHDHMIDVAMWRYTQDGCDIFYRHRLSKNVNTRTEVRFTSWAVSYHWGFEWPEWKRISWGAMWVIRWRLLVAGLQLQWIATAVDCKKAKQGEGRNVLLAPAQLPLNHPHLGISIANLNCWPCSPHVLADVFYVCTLT